MNFSCIVPGVSPRWRWLAAVVALVVAMSAWSRNADAQSVALTPLHDFLGNTEIAPFGKLIESPASSGTRFLGTSQSGGNGNGTIFQVTRDSDGSETVFPVYTFSIPTPNPSDPAHGTNPDGSKPNTLRWGGNEVVAADGYYYGTATSGGEFGYGTIFRVTPDGQFTTLYSFSAPDAVSQINADGATPLTTPLLGGDGNLYGTTSSGGAFGFGTVFMIARGGATTITTLCSLDASVGADARPHSLAEDDAGNLYGTSSGGGPAGTGTIFAVSAVDHSLTVYDFVGSGAGSGDGINPGQLIKLEGSNDFYSTTASGGINNAGTIFRFTPGSPPVVVYFFNADGGADGVTPGSPTRNGGIFYGATLKGGTSNTGTVFKYTPGGAEVVIHNFPAVTGTAATNIDGATPAGLTVTADQQLMYGLTGKGGSNGKGTIYTLTPDASAGTGFTVLSSFPKPANPLGGAAGPVAGMILGSDGKLYGTASRGGDNNNGTIFLMKPSNGALANVYSFDILLDGLNDYGANPQALFTEPLGDTGELLLGASGELIESPGGTFYGTAHDGGPGGTGTVFKVTVDAATLAGTPTPVHTFDALDGNGTNTDGAYPNTLIQGSDGNFYGTTHGGGANGTGTVFEVPAGGTGAFTRLYDFGAAGSGDGAGPDALLQSGNGIFYGTTSSGGANGTGTIFQFFPGGVPAVAYSFSALDGNAHNSEGASPTSLIEGSDGNLYGTAEYGGTSGLGAVFQFAPGSSAPVSFHAFTGRNGDGANPVAPLLQASDGNFYGTTYAGGSGGLGEVFRMTPSGVATPLYGFGGGDGSHPLGRLLELPDGYLYGTTFNGGVNDAGTAFRFQVAPVITSVLDVSAQAGLAVSYQITATGSPTSYGASGLPDGLTIDPTSGVISGTPKIEGIFQVTLQAANSGGTGTAALTLTVATAPPPAITSDTSARGQVGKVFQYQITATFSPTSYGSTVLPAGLVLNTTTGLISGTPLTAGANVVTISAVNAGGTGAEDLTVTIVPAAPAITSAAPLEGQVGVFYLYQITASNNPTSFATSSLPPGLYLNSATGLISGTPTKAGTFTMSLSATNAGGTGKPYNVTVTIEPAVPVITSAASASGQVGKAFTYQIVASHSPTSYNASGLLPGLAINTTTGRISGTPSKATDADGAKVTLTARNSGDTPGTATLILVVTAQPQLKPFVTTPSRVTGTVGTPLSLALSASNSPTSFNASGLPTGLHIDKKTGKITGTPTVVKTFIANVSATNSHGTGPTVFLTFIIAAPPNDVLFKFLGAPAGETFATGTLIHPYVQVTSPFNDHAFKKVTLDAIYNYNSSKPTTENIGGSNGAAFTLPWKPSKTGAVKLQVTATDTANNPYSAYEFITIKAPSATNTVRLISGLNGTNFAAGSTVRLVAEVDNIDSTFQGITFYANGQPFKTYPASGGVRAGASAKRSFAADPYTLPHNSEPVVFTVSAQTGSALMADADSAGSGNGAIDAATKTLLSSLALACNVVAPASATNGHIYLPANQAQTVATASVARKSKGTSHVRFFLNADQISGDVASPYSAKLPARPPGDYLLSAKATDDTLLLSAWSAPVTVTFVAPPVITSPATATGQVGIAFTYQIGAGNSPTSFGATGLPAGLRVDNKTGKITGTPTKAGRFSLTLQATSDRGGLGTATLSLTIQPATPAVNSPATATGQVGAMFTYQITATNNPTSFGASNLPPGLGVDQTTGKITGKPTTAGTFQPTVKAKITDATGTVTGTKQITLTIRSGDAPTITSALSVSGDAGAAFTYQIVATNNPTSFGVLGLPSFLTVNASGLLSGTLPASGTYPMTLTAANQSGPDSETFTLTVISHLPTVTIMPAGDSMAMEGGEKGKVFIMRAGGDTNQALTVHYKTKGSAKAGVDFKPLPGNVTIPPGALKAKIKIKPLENDVHDGTTKVKIKLLPATDGTYNVGDPSAANIKVIDDD